MLSLAGIEPWKGAAAAVCSAPKGCRPPCDDKQKIWNGTMEEDIEVTALRATSKLTGSQISRETMPAEMARCDYWYENPATEIKVGFRARVVEDIRQVEFNGVVKSAKVAVAVILANGELRDVIDKRCGARLSEEQRQVLVLDCYRLLGRYFTANFELYYRPHEPFEFKIYEGDANYLTAINRAVVGPEAIVASRARLVA